MPRFYLPMINWIRSHGLVRGAARWGIRFVPDLPITMNIPEFGKLCFGLRRHRWLMGANCLAGHALILGMFNRLTHPGDVFYDIGANIGYYVRFVAKNLPVSHLVAFEPMTANIRILQKNVALSGCPERITVLPIALGDTNSEEQLQIDDMGDGSAVLDRVSGGEPAEPRKHLGLGPKTEMASVQRLDDVIQRYSLRPPNVMKIDTEGAEGIVLKGGLRMLAQHHPRLAIALHGPQRFEEVLDLLLPLGYSCYGFVQEGEASRYCRLERSMAHILENNNIVCSVDEDEVREPIRPLDVPGANISSS